MSVSCDPTFENCDAVSADASTSPIMIEENFTTTQVPVEQWNILFGLQSTLLFYLGYKVNSWYPEVIEGYYDERVIGTDAYDLEWAKSTREISAWTMAAQVITAVQSCYWLIWLANFTLDNEGGALHHLFYIVTKSSQLFPFVLTALAYNINIAYPQSKQVETSDTDMAETISGNKWRKQYFFSIFTTQGAEINAYSTVEVTHQIYIWVAAFTCQIINSYAVPALTAQWVEARAEIEAEEEEAIATAKAAAAEQ
jgi:hypothetical protein